VNLGPEHYFATIQSDKFWASTCLGKIQSLKILWKYFWGEILFSLTGHFVL
jgi:hypothetical protein